MANLLDVTDLSVEYKDIGSINRVVNRLSFSVPAGQVVGLVGESGSGKSTAMLAVLGLTRTGAHIVSGNVQLDGRELTGLTLREWEQVRGRQIGLVTQNPRAALNPVMRVGELITAVYRSHNKVSRAVARERAIRLLTTLGINDPARRMAAFAHELSGGMAQRIVIAMALSCSPKLLIADEPTSGLDVTVQAQILDDLRNSVRQVGSGLLLVTRDLGVIANYCDRVYLLHAGEVVEHAPVETFFERPHHPAALALLSVQRRPQIEEFRLRGLPVDGRALPKGCFIAGRCPFVDPAAGCLTEHPHVLLAAPEHEVRCHRSTAVHEAWVDRLSAIEGECRVH